MLKMKPVLMVLVPALSVVVSADGVYVQGLNFLLVSQLDTVSAGDAFSWQGETPIPAPYDDMSISPQGAITNIDNGEYVGFFDIDLRETALLTMSYAYGGAASDNYVEVRMDSLGGEILDTMLIRNTGGWSSWVTDTSTVDNTNAQGVHTLFFIFRGAGGGLANVVAFVLVDTGVEIAAQGRASVPRRSVEQEPVSIIRLDGESEGAGIGTRSNLFTIQGRGMQTGIRGRGVTSGRPSGLYIVDWRNRSLSESR